MMAPLVIGLSAVYLDGIFTERKFVTLVALFLLVVAGNHEWVEGRVGLFVLNAAAVFYVLKHARTLPVDRVPV